MGSSAPALVLSRPMFSDAFLADLVTTVHLAIVVFMVAMILLVPVGGLLRWGWIRNPWLRYFHLGVMGYIVFNAIRGELCFLTHWEMDLRRAAGQLEGHGGLDEERVSFIGKLLHDVLFVEASQSVLHGIYIAVGVVVLAGIVFFPPRRGRNRAGEAAGQPG